MEAPHEFTQIMFPLKALKLVITDLRSSGETGRGVPHSGVVEADSDDGVSSETRSFDVTLLMTSQDDEWDDEDKVAQGLKEEEYAFLSGEFFEEVFFTIHRTTRLLSRLQICSVRAGPHSIATIYQMSSTMRI